MACAPSAGMQRRTALPQSSQAAPQEDPRHKLSPRMRLRALTPRPARAQEGTQGVAELQAKLEALQAQIEAMNAEKAAAQPPAPPPASPAADPCSVAVGNVSPMAVPEVVAAHFSMRAPRSVRLLFSVVVLAGKARKSRWSQTRPQRTRRLARGRGRPSPP